MKPPFKASDSAINVLSSPWFDMCTVWFVASLSCINMTLKSCWLCRAYLCNIRLVITSPSGSMIINLIYHSCHDITIVTIHNSLY